MDAWRSATFYGIVHGGQIVKEQGRRVKVLESNGEIGSDSIGEIVAKSEVQNDLRTYEATVIIQDTGQRLFQVSLQMIGKRQKIGKGFS